MHRYTAKYTFNCKKKKQSNVFKISSLYPPLSLLWAYLGPPSLLSPLSFLLFLSLWAPPPLSSPPFFLSWVGPFIKALVSIYILIYIVMPWSLVDELINIFVYVSISISTSLSFAEIDRWSLAQRMTKRVEILSIHLLDGVSK